MSRNPHATNLRHFKPKRIEDKRDHHLARLARLATNGGSGVNLAGMSDDEVLARLLGDA